MNDKSNKYALAALKNRRGELLGEIKRMKDAIAYREEQLAHLDATILLLEPTFQVDTIRPKRPRQVKLFGKGELNKLILDTLRDATAPMTPRDIALAILERQGFGDAALPALCPRVRGNLSYLWRSRRLVTKQGERLNARWCLNPPDARSADRQ